MDYSRGEIFTVFQEPFSETWSIIDTVNYFEDELPKEIQ